ncbi:MAG TPA: hypothetical protein VHW90_14395 [Stellaceae bacterium]|nr:hypothetical protein [Stellaceae bacterium]
MNRVSAMAAATIVTGLIISTAAVAQSAGPAANPNPSTPPIATSGSSTPLAPAAGANSFTEDQAKSRIAAAGYTNVSSLTKDKDGVWRGTASKGSASGVSVALDYQGNVVAQ